jgi:arylsulfatase A-like enzyme
VPDGPDIVILMTDEERAIPPYESADVLAWRDQTLKARKWFDGHGVGFGRHYTGSLACVPARCRPWATGSAPPGTTPTTTASGTSPTPT